MNAEIMFSKDVVSLGDLKVNPGKIIRRTRDTKRPVLLTSRGKGVAVVQSLEEYEARQEELAFRRAIAQGLTEASEGKTIPLDEIKAELAHE